VNFNWLSLLYAVVNSSLMLQSLWEVEALLSLMHLVHQYAWLKIFSWTGFLCFIHDCALQILCISFHFASIEISSLSHYCEIAGCLLSHSLIFLEEVRWYFVPYRSFLHLYNRENYKRTGKKLLTCVRPCFRSSLISLKCCVQQKELLDRLVLYKGLYILLPPGSSNLLGYKGYVGILAFTAHYPLYQVCKQLSSHKTWSVKGHMLNIGPDDNNLMHN